MLMETDTDEALLDSLQESAFDYFIHYRNPANGLVADASKEGAPCSIAAMGFALSVYPVGVERGWIGRGAAARWTLTALRFFAESAQSRVTYATGYRGFYYHFLDMNDGRRAWRSELSLIDSALLFAGMLTAAAYFTRDNEVEAEIRAYAAMLYGRANWAWALNGGEILSHGWKPHSGFLPHRWEGYNEALILYILALASPSYPVAPASYAAFTAKFEWIAANEQPFLYAGPLFIHLFSHAWIDFRGIRDRTMAEKNTDYFHNTRLAIDVQRGYAITNPERFAGYGPDVWGLTACDGPGRPRRLIDGRRQRFARYAARGAPYGPDDGTIAPWAPAVCLPFAPEAALSGLWNILSAYPDVLQDGRFVGSFNPSVRGPTKAGWLNDRCIGLDQGLLVMMIENYRNGGIWDITRRSPVIQLGLERAGFSGGWLSGQGPSAWHPPK